MQSKTLAHRIALAALTYNLCTTTASAAIPTHIKPGLWQEVMTMSMRISMAGQTMAEPPRTVTGVFCSDGSLGAVEKNPTASGDCTDESSTLNGNTLTAVSVCPVSLGMTGVFTNHLTLVFESDDWMHLVTHGESPNMMIDMAGDWKWQSACPAGVNPGDTGQMVNGNFVSGNGAMASP